MPAATTPCCNPAFVIPAAFTGQTFGEAFFRLPFPQIGTVNQNQITA
jgi:hypothetical protein